MGVTVYHWEAGNRSFDPNVPEEINRKVIDHLADFNICYSEQARRNLIDEGLPSRRVSVSGSPMGEVISNQRASIEASEILKELKLESNGYIVASFHRQENVDSAQRLKKILESLKMLNSHFGLKIIVSLHPRTASRIKVIEIESDLSHLIFVEPLNFRDYMCLQTNAFCTVSDSGTISEESAILGFPAITIRDSMERPEALEMGSLVMTGLEPINVLQGVKWSTQHRPKDLPSEYKVGDASHRIVSLIQSTLHASASWDGLRAIR
jgi:UDP-N-acetylglucosamine 2-epimerase (non-hydrolysing)